MKAPGAENNLNNLIEEYLSWKMKNSPTISTMMGYHEYNDLLEDFSKDAISSSLRDLKDFLSRLSSIKCEGLKDADSQIDFDLLKRDIDGELRGIEKFRHHAINPSVYSDLALQSLYILSNRSAIPLEERTGSILKKDG